MGSFRLLSRLALVLAFVPGLLLLANARPLEEEASTSRELLNWCPPSGCPTYDPGCNLVPLSDLCYFTPAMLKLNPMPVTAYYCGLSCPSWRAKSPGQYNIVSQKDCPAVTCAKTIGQVTAQNGGCASSAGYINAQASGQTKELYYNVDGSWITSQLKGFCLGGPSTGSLTAVAGMLAEGFASSLASTCIGGTQYVCGCCNGQETATQTISAFTSAGARARVQAFVQAVTVVFGPGGDCDNADVLAQASSTADALAEDLIQIIDGFYNQISLSKFGARDFYNQVCTSANVPVLDHLKVQFANAYACAIASVLSSASITTTPNPTGTTVTDYSASCSDNYEIAFSTDWVPGTHVAKCANACKCDKASLTSGAGCPAGIKVCPGGTCEYIGS